MTSDIGPTGNEGTCPRIHIHLAGFVSEIASTSNAASAFSAAASDDVATYVSDLVSAAAGDIMARYLAAKPEVADALLGLFQEVANGDANLTINLAQTGPDIDIERSGSSIVVTLCWAT
jgi:hypothetical protein